MTIEEMKQAKRERGYSMAQLSELSGVPVGTLQKIFTGETKTPRYATRQAIERVLMDFHKVCIYPSGDELEREVSHEILMLADSHGADSRRMDSHGVDSHGADSRRADSHGADSHGADYNEYLAQLDVPLQVSEAAPKYGESSVKQKKQGEYTIEDYYALPEDRRVELIDGVFYEMLAPGSMHQMIVSQLCFEIKTYITKKNGSCLALPSPLDVRLDRDDRTMVEPDVVILCDRTKLRRWGIMGAPDFVLEVVSKSSKRKDYIKKLQKYTDAGVREYWIVDPYRKMLLTYAETDDYMPCMHSLTGKVGVGIYDGELQIDLDEIAALTEELPE